MMLRTTLLLTLLLPAALAEPPKNDDADPYPNRGRYEGKLLTRSLLGGTTPDLGFRAGEHAGGRLALERGIPVLTLTGTPEQMGVQHGTLLRAQLPILMRRYLLRFLRTDDERAKARRVARELEPHILPRHRAEIRAAARAAGMTQDDALLVHSFLDAYKVAFCSTAVVSGERSAAGEPLFARNLDFPDLGIAHRASVLVIHRPKGHHAFASVTWPGMVGVLSGVNEHGLAVAVMVAHEGTPYGKGMPYTLLFRTVLEEAKTTEQALAILRRTPRTTGNNLMICDAAGTARVAELTVERVVVRTPTDGLLLCTNHFDRGGAAPPHKSLAYPSSIRRYRTMSRLLGRAKTIDRALMHRALSRTAIKLTNIQAMIFAPRSRRLWLSVGTRPAADGVFVRFDLKERMTR